jgi:hypothetical protein
MTMIRKSSLLRLSRLTLCWLLLAAGLRAQNSAGSGDQTPLGDVVRQQREQRQHSKTAKRVVSDDDIPANHYGRSADSVAEYVIIPAIKISGPTPLEAANTVSPIGQKRGKIYVGFGPHLGWSDWCGGLDCAEQAFLRHFQRGGWVPGSAHVLFDSNDAVGDYEARIAHFEILNDVRGRMQGAVALIEVPMATLMAYCIYDAKERPEAEPECEAFISSLQVDVPERFIYVKH